jgi:hypothetical protein
MASDPTTVWSMTAMFGPAAIPTRTDLPAASATCSTIAGRSLVYVRLLPMKSIESPAGVSEEVAGEQPGPSSRSAAIGSLHIVVPRL